MRSLCTRPLGVLFHTTTGYTTCFSSPWQAVCLLRSLWMISALGLSLIFIYVSFSLGAKVCLFRSKCTTDSKLSHSSGPGREGSPSTSGSSTGSRPSVELSQPVVAVSPKKKRGPQKGYIRGTTPDSEVWNMNDDEIIGIVFRCPGIIHILTCL